MKLHSEKRFVRKLANRDTRAFELLVKRYQGPVFNFVFRMLGNREEAEDLAQEVFVKVFKKIDSFRGESSLSTWIYRVASNMCKNRQQYLGRRYHNRPSKNGLEEGSLNEDNSYCTTGRISRPDELVEGYQMEQLLQKAISELEEEPRLILILRDIQGLSYDDIASIVGLPLGTVKSRLHRARMSLKEKIGPQLR